MAQALIILALIFGLLFFSRLAGAWRATLAPRWPAVALGMLAAFLVFRGSIRTALLMSALAVISWYVAPRLLARRASPVAEDARDVEARKILGIRPNADEAEIRRAYREKIAQAHPDRGGSHDQAARLTAARDRLLRKRN